MTHNHAEQARARKMADALASGIDDALISRLVEGFYDTVRQDDLLGPIFVQRIDNWPHHLARMKDFWASIMLESGRFSGNPMSKHIAIGGLDEAHCTLAVDLGPDDRQDCSERNGDGSVTQSGTADRRKPADGHPDRARRVYNRFIWSFAMNRGQLSR